MGVLLIVQSMHYQYYKSHTDTGKNIHEYGLQRGQKSPYSYCADTAHMLCKSVVRSDTMKVCVSTWYHYPLTRYFNKPASV